MSDVVINFLPFVATKKKKSARGIGWRFLSLLHFLEFGSLESPPSNSLRATRKPDVLVLSEIAGKGLVVGREGISTPNAPYLR